jgi:hypothetical protein
MPSAPPSSAPVPEMPQAAPARSGGALPTISSAVKRSSLPSVIPDGLWRARDSSASIEHMFYTYYTSFLQKVKRVLQPTVGTTQRPTLVW